jgi:hypothetical protein
VNMEPSLSARRQHLLGLLLGISSGASSTGQTGNASHLFSS